MVNIFTLDQKILKFSVSISITSLDLGHYLIPLQCDDVIICESPNLEVSSSLAFLNPTSEGSWMRFLAVSFASPFANLIKQVSLFPESVILFSTTSLKTTIKL